MVVVLSVNVIRNGAAKCDKPGARHNRKEPSLGHDDLQYFIQCQSGLAIQDSALRIKPNETVEPPSADLRAMAVNTTVTVTTTSPES